MIEEEAAEVEKYQEANWVTFDAFPDYAFSDLGEVFNLRTNRFLTPSPNDNGYYRVGLFVRGKQRFLYMHRVIAMAFLLDYTDRFEVWFKDGDKTNFRASNLYMGTKPARQRETKLW